MIANLLKTPTVGELKPLGFDEYHEYLQSKVDVLNALQGDLPDYQCDICKNRGVIYYVTAKNEQSCRPCSCTSTRDSIRRIRKSGLGQMLESLTFDSFEHTLPHQEDMYSSALRYIDDYTNQWFYCGGQIGCGKTHICTALCGRFIALGHSTRYMLWRDEIVKIKANVTDDAAYQRLIDPLKTVKCLYIDDFLKTEKNKAPSAADINVAFEIFNHRYICPDLITIISSEKDISDLLDIDEAVGSRIYQRSKNYCIEIQQDKEKNYRLR